MYHDHGKMNQNISHTILYFSFNGLPCVSLSVAHIGAKISHLDGTRVHRDL